MRAVYLILTSIIILLITGYSYFWVSNATENSKKELIIMNSIAKSAITNVNVFRNGAVESEKCSKDCKDCIYFPVSKNQSLRSDYAPEVILTGLPGGREVTIETKVALNDLFLKANELGLTPTVISGYRSYNTQKGLFNSYVNNEQAKNNNLSRSEAETKANIYSAIPGHSEHQLGTTVDISCPNCVPFGIDKNSKQIYDFLKQYAVEYGFVISYPEGSENLTGYKYEPWHIRYVGNEVAVKFQEFNKYSSNITLDKYLSLFCLEK